MDPVKIVKDSDGVCKCPQCANALRYIEAQPVTVVDGKLNLADSEAHYKCELCHLSFRRLVHTEYFQCYTK
jgi:transposase-like protein